jgi:hypothetical protein
MNKEDKWLVAIIAALVLGVWMLVVVLTLGLGAISYELYVYNSIGERIAQMNENPPVIQGPPLQAMPKGGSTL